MDHLNRYPYANQKPTPTQLSVFLKRTPNKWLIQHDGDIVGFFVYGNFIPHQPNAFGMAIGQRYTRRGFGEQVLREFIRRRSEFAVNEINAYCSLHNQAMIGLLNKVGFIHDSHFRDPIDPDAVKYQLPL